MVPKHRSSLKNSRSRWPNRKFTTLAVYVKVKLYWLNDSPALCTGVREATLMSHSDDFTEFVISIICLTNWNKSGLKRVVLVTDVAAQING